MVNLDDVIKLIEWRDEVQEKKKARAIQRAIDNFIAKIDKRGITFSLGGFSVSDYARLEIKCWQKGLKINAW